LAYFEIENSSLQLSGLRRSCRIQGVRCRHVRDEAHRRVQARPRTCHEAREREDRQ